MQPAPENPGFARGGAPACPAPAPRSLPTEPSATLGIHRIGRLVGLIQAFAASTSIGGRE
jgi:hypothetical protein